MINLSALSGAIAQATDALAESRDLRAQVAALKEDAVSSQASVDALVAVLTGALAPQVAPAPLTYIAPAPVAAPMPAAPAAVVDAQAAINVALSSALANTPV